MVASSHVDGFVREHLPPLAALPEFRFDLPELQYPERLNCAASLLDAAVAEGYGEQVAIVDATRHLTYRDLLTTANRMAAVLRFDLGLVPGRRVLLRGYNGATLAACWYAVVKAGCIAVTTMPLLRTVELTDVLTRARIDAALCDERLAPELEDAAARAGSQAPIVTWSGLAAGDLGALMLRHDGTFDNVDTAATDPVLVAFTSGTTGRSKGTVHVHRDVLAICDTFAAQHVAATAGDIFCGTPPLAFTYGLGGLLIFPARARATVVLLESAPPNVLLSAIAEHGATICFAAPTAYRAMTSLAPQFDLRTLRTCVSAGEDLPAASRAAWKAATGIDIVDGIGSTEMLHIFIAASGDGIRPGATGKPVRGYVATVLDDEGRPLGSGHVGRLAVKGPTGCRYLDDARQAQYVHDGWNVTGDAYLIDDDGYFWYQARTDDMIVSAGYNIAGPEVEAALLKHEFVRECAVVGVSDPERGKLVKAFVVLHEGIERGPDSARALQTFVKASIAPYKYPRAIEFVDALPRTETGKLKRHVLRERTPERPEDP